MKELTYDDYQKLQELMAAFRVVLTHGPFYIKPTYMQGTFNAIENVAKLIKQCEDTGVAA